MTNATKKIISALTVLCFVMTQNLFASPGMGIEIMSARETPALLQIDIPAELATLDGLYEAPLQPSPKLILHIQNAHANYGAQQKIKELLQYLEKNYAVKTIFVEGASEDLNPDYLKMFPDKERNLKLADFLAKQGELTGAEMYLLEGNGEAVKAHGIETADLYRENYEALKKVFGGEVTVKHYLDGFEGRLSTLSSKVFSKGLLKLLGEWKKFEKGHREFMPYVKTLAAEAKRVLNVDLESLLSQIEWPQITRLLVLQTMEKELDMKKGIAERDQLIQFLKEKRVSQKLISSIENFQDQRVTVISGNSGSTAAPVQPAMTGTTSSRERAGITGFRPRDLMEQLAAEAGPKGFYFYNYPNFSLYAGYLILKSELDPKGLFNEIKVLFTRLLDQLAQTPREKQLLELCRNEELVRKLLNLELTRKDWQEVLAKKDLLAMDALVAGLKDIGTAVSLESGLPLTNFETKPVNPKFRSEVADVQAAAYGFYDAAHRREDVFYEKIASVMEKDRLNKAVVITGGFHTDGMTELLREHEVSYGVLTPRLSEKSDENLYRSVMLQNKPGLFELSYLEAASQLMSLATQEAQIGKTAVAGRLAAILRGIGAAGEVGSVDESVQIFNQSAMAALAGIQIEKTGQNTYKIVSVKTQTPVSAPDIGKVLATPSQIIDAVGSMAGSALPATNPAVVVPAVALAGQLGQVGKTTEKVTAKEEVKAPETPQAETVIQEIVAADATKAGIPDAEFAAAVAENMKAQGQPAPTGIRETPISGSDGRSEMRAGGLKTLLLAALLLGSQVTGISGQSAGATRQEAAVTVTSPERLITGELSRTILNQGIFNGVTDKDVENSVTFSQSQVAVVRAAQDLLIQRKILTGDPASIRKTAVLFLGGVPASNYEMMHSMPGSFAMALMDLGVVVVDKAAYEAVPDTEKIAWLAKRIAHEIEHLLLGSNVPVLVQEAETYRVTYLVLKILGGESAEQLEAQGRVWKAFEALARNPGEVVTSPFGLTLGQIGRLNYNGVWVEADMIRILVYDMQGNKKGVMFGVNNAGLIYELKAAPAASKRSEVREQVGPATSEREDEQGYLRDMNSKLRGVQLVDVIGDISRAEDLSREGLLGRGITDEAYTQETLRKGFFPIGTKIKGGLEEWPYIFIGINRAQGGFEGNECLRWGKVTGVPGEFGVSVLISDEVKDPRVYNYVDEAPMREVRVKKLDEEEKARHPELKETVGSEMFTGLMVHRGNLPRLLQLLAEMKRQDGYEFDKPIYVFDSLGNDDAAWSVILKASGYKLPVKTDPGLCASIRNAASVAEIKTLLDEAYPREFGTTAGLSASVLQPYWRRGWGSLRPQFRSKPICRSRPQREKCALKCAHLLRVRWRREPTVIC